jgi:hypothetical protein
MRTDQAAIAAQEVQQFAKVYSHTQGTGGIQQVGNVDKHTYTLGRGERWECH